MATGTLEGCGALIYCKSTRRHLFLLRSHTRHQNSWGLVGGKAEANETIRDTLLREINEEIGLDLSDSKLIPLEKFTSESKQFVYHTFLIPVEAEFCPTLNHEHKGYCWVNLTDYPKPLHPGVWRTFKFDVIVKKIKTLEDLL